jgi:hypothetical protein
MVRNKKPKQKESEKEIEIPDNYEFTFKLLEEEVNVILVALQELPGKICNPLTENLRKQAIEQLEGKTIHHTIDENVGVEEQMGG